jgi:hypothetical protein
MCKVLGSRLEFGSKDGLQVHDRHAENGIHILLAAELAEPAARELDLPNSVLDVPQRAEARPWRLASGAFFEKGAYLPSGSQDRNPRN